MIKHTAIIKLPYPIRVGFFSINSKKKIGLSFDNLSMFLLRENLGFEKSSDHEKWVKNNGNERLFVETIWAAAKSYHVSKHGIESFKLKKDKFMIGIQQIGKESMDEILRAYKNSQSYGFKDGIGKKKAERK